MRVLLFDVFGTLVDWRSSLIDLAERDRGTGTACRPIGPQSSTTGVGRISLRWTESATVLPGVTSTRFSARRWTTYSPGGRYG